MNTLAVIDPQIDFVTGALKNEAAQKVIPSLAKLIREWEGPVVVTHDTHEDKLYDYTLEGQKLKSSNGLKHCIGDDDKAYRDEDNCGWGIVPEIKESLKEKYYKDITKESFGTFDWCDRQFDRIISQAESITVVGFVSDICVISNLVILRTLFPDKKIIWDSRYSAGTTQENHLHAIAIAKAIMIEVIV